MISPAGLFLAACIALYLFLAGMTVGIGWTASTHCRATGHAGGEVKANRIVCFDEVEAP